MTATGIKDKAHQYLIDKGCKSMAQTYSAFTVEKMLVEFAVDKIINPEINFWNQIKDGIQKL